MLLIESEESPAVTELVRIGRSDKRPQARRLRRCPHCGGDMIELSPKMRLPRKLDDREWKALAVFMGVVAE